MKWNVGRTCLLNELIKIILTFLTYTSRPAEKQAARNWGVSASIFLPDSYFITKILFEGFLVFKKITFPRRTV